MISEEGLTLEPGTRLNRSRAFYGRVLLKYKNGQRKRLTQTSEGRRKVPHSLVFSKQIIYFLISYYSKSKECLKFVKILPDPLPQFTF